LWGMEESLSRGIEAGIPAFAVEKTHRIKPFHLESVRMAREAGVGVAMGTDAGTPFNMHGEQSRLAPRSRPRSWGWERSWAPSGKASWLT